MIKFEKGQRYENINNGLVYSCVRIDENGCPYLSRNARGVGTLGFILEPENFTKFKAHEQEFSYED